MFNLDRRDHVGALFETAAELEEQVAESIAWLREVQGTLSRLTALYPESLSFEDWADAD
ncbi:MAG: hypothetical protein WCA32_16440 [Chromatiaceae bacterium]